MAVDRIDAAVEGRVDSVGISENVGERGGRAMVVAVVVVLVVMLEEVEAFLAAEVEVEEEACDLTGARRVEAGAGSRINGEELPVASRRVDPSTIDSSSSSLMVGSTITSSTHDGRPLVLPGSDAVLTATVPIAAVAESSLLVSLCQKVPCSPVACSLPK